MYRIDRTYKSTINKVTDDDYYNAGEISKRYHKKEPYIFTVSAVNSVGETVSDPTADFLPLTSPGKPTITTINSLNSSATVSFTPPTDTGGYPITLYTVTANPGGITAIGQSSPIVVTGLTNGTQYTFTVTATNISGNSSASTATTATPNTIPDEPKDVIATLGTVTKTGGTVTISFKNSTKGYGNTYTAKAIGGTAIVMGTVITTSTGGTATISGLTNGTTYIFIVIATNSAGSTESQQTQAIKIPDIPSKPTNISSGSNTNSINFSFTVPPNNGSPITSYKLRGYYTDNTGKIFYEDVPNISGLSFKEGDKNSMVINTTDRTKQYTKTPISISDLSDSNMTKSTTQTLTGISNLTTIPYVPQTGGSVGTVQQNAISVQPYAKVPLLYYPIGKERKEFYNSNINNKNPYYNIKCVSVIIFILFVIYCLCTCKKIK